MKSLMWIVWGASLLFVVNQSSSATPPLNKEIVTYVRSVIGKQVDRGECWDLANQALIRSKAKWDGLYQYGNKVDPKKDQIYPGDIIQFENVQVKYKIDNSIYTETMDHHTAIVYKVLDKGKYEIAHQNTGFSGRTVGVSTLDLSQVTKGKLKFYRPMR
jgi:hypothetical protein